MKRLALALSVTCLAVVAIVAARAILSDDGGARSAGPVPTVSRNDRIAITSPLAPKVDSVIDLSSGAMEPLPDSIIRAAAKPDEIEPDVWPGRRYAASRDGSRLAFVGRGEEEGSPQIFIARTDGSGVRQATHDPRGAMFPAWSPDAGMIAYNQQADRDGSRLLGSWVDYGYGVGTLFVLDVGTGESTPLPEAGPVDTWSGHQFTPDGSSLLYTSGRRRVLRTVPVDGGKSTVFIGPDQGMADATSGSLSPDGSLVTMMGDDVGPYGGGLRFVANADGTELRLSQRARCNPAGTWSPDGKHIVCVDRTTVVVVDVATGQVFPVAKGNGAIWLDRHTLLVEASSS